MDKLPGWKQCSSLTLSTRVKHVVPNDLFETNLLTEVTVYTMDAADARKNIEDANPLRQSRRN
jgi:hypothetical protein